jgi:hypothetical protein
MNIGIAPDISDVISADGLKIRNHAAGAMIALQPGVWQNNLWPYEPGMLPMIDGVFFDYDGANGRQGFFTSTVPVGATTGALQQFAMRIDNANSCEHVDPSTFEMECTGTGPIDSYFYNSTSSPFSVQICYLNGTDGNPWQYTSSPQEIVEKIYFQVTTNVSQAGNGGQSLTVPYNFTVKCTGQSTLGYFELGNAYYDFDPVKFFDGFSGFSGGRPGSGNPAVPSLPYSPFANGPSYSEGPLTTAARILFGNTSYLALSHNQNVTDAYQKLSEAGTFPLGNFLQGLGQSTPTDPYNISQADVDFAVWSITESCNDANYFTQLMNAASFFASEAILGEASIGSIPNRIYADPGTIITVPVVSYPALIVISTLIGLQVFGILALSIYVLRHPTWTSRLDALAIARIGAALPPETLPPIRRLLGPHVESMDSVEGIIGVVREDTVTRGRLRITVPILGVGGKGSI